MEFSSLHSFILAFNYLVSILNKISLSRRRQYTTMGVPMTTMMKNDIFRPEYKLEPRSLNWSTRRTFYYGLFKYSVIIGIIGAWYFTDDFYLQNDLNNRPDLLPMRHMTDYSMPMKERKVFSNLYHGNFFSFNKGQGNYHGKTMSGITEHSNWRKLIRYFYPYYEYDSDGYNYSVEFDTSKDYNSVEYKNHYHFDH